MDKLIHMMRTATFRAGAPSTPPPDPASPPVLSISGAPSLSEGSSGSTAFTFTVSRSGDTAGTSSASWAAAGSGANPASASDFAGGAFPSGTVTFAPGEVSKSITMNVSGDTTAEPAETFTVTLSNPSSGTTIGTAGATGTIQDDDTAAPPPTPGTIEGPTAYSGSVTSLWTGHTTPDGVTVSTQTTQPSSLVRIVASTSSDLSNPVYSPAAATVSITTDANVTSHIAKPTITGLSPNVDYHYGLLINGNLHQTIKGKFRTLPPQGTAASFRFGFSSCAATNTNSSNFTVMRGLSPPMLFFQHMGDMHYADPTSNNEGYIHRFCDQVLASSQQGPFFREVPVRYMWDDHDFGPNNSDSRAASKPASLSFYRKRVPSPPLAFTGASDPVCYRYQVGRVVFIITDTRSQASGGSTDQNANNTMLGAAQKQWFKDTLTNPAYADCAFVWNSTQPYHTNDTIVDNGVQDDWSSYWKERAEITDFMHRNGIWGRILVISGDMHAIAVDSGANANYTTDKADRGGIPVPIFHAAPLNNGPSDKGGPYSQGLVQQNGQFGVFDITDTGGDTITFAFTGRNAANTTVLSYTATLRTTPAPPSMVGSQSFGVGGIAVAGTAIGTVKTTQGYPTGFAITTGNSSGYFAVSAAGVLTKSAGSVPTGSYPLTIQAANGAGNASAIVTVSVT